jgi:hypothetical protein
MIGIRVLNDLQIIKYLKVDKIERVFDFYKSETTKTQIIKVTN